MKSVSQHTQKWYHGLHAAAACLLLMLTVACATNTPEVPQKTEQQIEITTTIKAALVGAPDVDAASVRITLADNEIVLSGFVSTEGERDEVIRLSELHAKGYVVTNDMTIRSPVIK